MMGQVSSSRGSAHLHPRRGTCPWSAHLLYNFLCATHPVLAKYFIRSDSFGIFFLIGGDKIATTDDRAGAK